MRFDWLVVGAGYTGCVLAERVATELGQRVLVVDRRRHIGGNAHDCYNADGHLVHAYGPHAFHTNSARVWDYLSRFTAWRPYCHRVRAMIDGREVPVPFNLDALYALLPPRHAGRLEDRLLAEFGFGAKVPIMRLREHADPDIAALAAYVYDKVFLGYTTKQWGCPPEELGPAVMSRVPVHLSRDDRYFQDTYQAMPREGYTALFERMLAHAGIKVLLGTDYREVAGEVRYDRMVYTGPIDEFFDCRHGALPYRSLRFEYRLDPADLVQEVAQVNYPNEHAYTRITEFKHLTGQRARGTTLAVEYPEAHASGQNEPYYPIPRDENRALYERYRAEAADLGDRVFFVGRLADYRYYNMDQVVARALQVFESEIVPAVGGAGRGKVAPAG